MKPKISLITLGVTDLPRALAFYRDGLGFPTHNHTEGDEMVMFALEGTWLGLYPLDELAKDAQAPIAAGGHPRIVLAHNAPSRAEVDRVYAQALAAGARGIKTPRDVFWGGYSGYFADPEEHLWEVAFNPFTDLT